MSNAIEIEAKILISQDDYRKLAKLFPECPRYIQTNYYIDSENRILNKEGIAFFIKFYSNEISTSSSVIVSSAESGSTLKLASNGATNAMNNAPTNIPTK